jgi:hypothetical protein
MVRVISGKEAEAAVEKEKQTEPAASTTAAMPTQVEFTLPGGKVVKMGKPAIPVKLLLPALMASNEFNPQSMLYQELLVRTILHVREIDGKPTPTVENFGQIQQIALQLGDQGLEAAELIMAKNFPTLTEAQLQIVKK